MGICGLCGLGWLTNTQDPNYLFSLIIFFLLIFVTVFSITMFVTNIVRRSILIGSGVFVFFLLRLLGPSGALIYNIVSALPYFP